MKACWKEDAQVVASEPQKETVIENVHKFCDFYKVLNLKGLWNENFAELADNEPFGCTLKLTKMGLNLGAIRGRPSALLVLTGWWYPVRNLWMCPHNQTITS